MALLKKKKISPKKLKRYKTVFGDDVEFDADGKPIEQGIGSPGNENLTHFQAILKSAQIKYKYNATPEHKAEVDAAQKVVDEKLKEFSILEEESDKDENDEDDWDNE